MEASALQVENKVGGDESLISSPPTVEKSPRITLREAVKSMRSAQNATSTPIITVLCIGDPHFKGDNKHETDLMELQVRELIIKLNPTFVVVLGDILHTHEKIDLRANKRATSFLRMLRSVSNWLYVLIGNHDRPDNNVFLTDDHV